MKRPIYCILICCLLPALGGGALCAQPFITTWKTDNPGTSNNNQITIPGTGTNYLIQWEQVGNPANNGSTMGNDVTTVTFPTPGMYRVSISGNFTQIRFATGDFNNPTVQGDPQKLLTIEQWGSIAWSRMEQAFQGCSNMNCVATDVPNLSAVMSMSAIFADCTVFNGTIENWNTAAVTDMSWMFLNATSFNQPIGNWNTAAVTYMGSMFDGASSFNQPIGNWNTSAVTEMVAMFRGASSFNQPIGSWNTAAVTSMGGMFFEASSFNQPIDNWNTAAVTYMAAMFWYASSFNQPIGNWNTAAVTNMGGMFGGANSFDQPIGNWNTAAVSDMNNMFYNASSFNQPIGNWNTAAVTDMTGMFSNANSFDQPIGNWNTAAVGSMFAMFSGANSFNQPIGNWNTALVTDMTGMFGGANSFDQPIGNWNTAAVTNMYGMFAGANSFNQPIGNWNTVLVTDMAAMFQYASSFNQPIGNWNTAAVTNMYRMFWGASAFNQDLGNWNLSFIQTTSSFINLIEMLDNSGLDCANYDATLTGWAANPATPNGLTLGALGLSYGDQSAHNALMNGKGWTITGDSFDPACGPCSSYTASLSGTTTICQGESTTLTFNFVGGTGTYTVVWANGTLNNINNGHMVSVSPTSTIAYSISSATDAGGCPATVGTSATVTVNPNQTPTFTQVAAICSGGSFSLPANSNNGITGIWSPAINNTATTTYTFSPNAGQCATTAMMTVTVVPLPNANNPGFPLERCDEGGGIATFPLTSLNGIISGGIGTVSWFSNAAGTISVPTPNAYLTSSGIVYATVSNGICTSQAMPVSLQVNLLPIVSLALVQPISCAASANGAVSTSVSGAPGPFTFDWNINALDGIQNPSGLGAGTYSVTVTDGASCTASASVTLTNPAALTVVCTQPNPAIPNASIEINGGTPGYNIAWNGPVSGSANTSGNSYTLSNLPTGTYLITVTDGNGCMQQSSFVISTSSSGIFFTIGSASNVQSGEQVCLNVTAAGFTNIVGLQFSISYNPAMLQLSSVSNFGLPGLTAGSSFGLPIAGGAGATAAGVVTMNWTDPDQSGETLSNGATIFTLCFNALASTGTTLVSFTGTPTPIGVTNTAQQFVPFNSVPGTVTFGPVSCTHPDFDALMALYNSTNGPGWTNNSGWVEGAAGTSCDPCTWYGIECDGDGRVICLHLDGLAGGCAFIIGPGNNLAGTIPSEIGNLSRLQFLSLHGNQLTGPIPSQIGNLSQLEALGLFNNQLNGNIPPTLGNLSNLKWLNLSNNQLNGSIPSELGNIPGLLELRLNDNLLSGCIPASLQNLCPTVTNGNLSNNAALASQSWSNFCNAQSGICTSSTSCPSDSLALVALYNATNGPGWTNRSNWLVPGQPISNWYGVSTNADGCVDTLHLGSNNLTGVLPSELGNLSQLKLLNLSVNNLSGGIPSSLGQLSQLELLNLSLNRLRGSLPSELGQLTQMRQFYCDQNDSLYGPIPATLAQWTLIEILNMSVNYFSGTIPAGVQNWQNLRRCFLNTNRLSGNIPAGFGQLNQLERLNLSINQLTGGIPAALANMPAIDSLYLNNNMLSGCIPQELLALCPRLSGASIASNPGLLTQSWGDFCNNSSGACTPTNPGAFITTWKTDNPGTSANNQITIPGTGTNYTIAWEEVGNPANNGTAIGNNTTTVTFPTPGTYLVSISGDFTRIRFDIQGDRQKLLTIEQWGSIAWSSMEEAFFGCSNMDCVAVDAPNLSGVTSMRGMFAFCAVFNGAIGQWNTATVTDMNTLFAGATSFNQPISNWNTSLVTNMNGMFAGASSFNQPINTWNTGSVTDMSVMFMGAVSFNQPIDSWNISSVEDMQSMFDGAIAFNQPIDNWNTATVTFMNNMFLDASAFNQPVGNWDTRNVMDMSAMFSGASSFNQNLGNWDLSGIISHFDCDFGDTNLCSMFDNSGLDCANYDATLAGWAANPATPNGLTLGAQGLSYGAQSARDSLVNLKGWTITGDSYQNCNYSSPCTLVTTTADSGPGSLREAVICANNNPGPDTIRFNIPGAGPHIIFIGGSLPDFDDDYTVLDATTQPGWQPGYIVVDGINMTLYQRAMYGQFVNGIEVYGLTVRNAAGRGLAFQLCDGIKVGAPGKGCIFYNNGRLDPPGAQQGAANLQFWGCTDSSIKSSRFGVTEHNTAATYRSFFGIEASGENIDIGGSIAAGEGNIAGNCAVGIRLWSDPPIDLFAQNIRIRGNIVGTDSSGVENWANLDGINLWNQMDNIEIGGDSPDFANVIRNNQWGFIAHGPGDDNKQARLSQNSFACNDTPIEFSTVVNARIVVITSATPTTVSGTATPGDWVEIFESGDMACPDAPCQGKTYLGGVFANASGLWTLNGTFVPGTSVTATGTGNGITWGFADCKVVCPSNISSIMPTGSTTFCAGGNVVLNAPSGTGYDYQWQRNATNIGGAISANYTATQSGDYRLIVSQNTCADTSAVLTVTVNPIPTVGVAGTTPANCNQATGSVTLSVSGATGTPTYLWSNGAMTQNLNNVAAGSYSVTVTSGNGCTATASANVPGTNAPTVGIAGTTPANCNQATGSVTLSVSGATGTPTYLWSNGATTQNLNNVAAGSYSVTVTSGNGCTATTSATVPGTNAPTVGIANTTPANCNQATGSVTLSVSGTTGTPTYLWSNGATTQNLSNVAAGSYSVTVTSGNGCTATTSANVPGTNAPTVGIANTTPANCNQATGSVTLSVSGATGTPTYLWSNGATTQNLNNVAVGSYSVTVTSGNGCTATASANVPGTNAPTVGIANTTPANCNQATGSVTLSVSGATGTPTYLWSNGATTQNLNNVAAGSYSVTVTSGNGCTATTTAQVTGTTPPTVNIAGVLPVVCSQPNGTINISVSGATGTPSYLWSTGATSPNLAGIPIGSYTVTVTSGNGCTATATAQVTGTTAASVTVLQVTQPGCNQSNGIVVLSVTNATGTPTFLWSNGATTQNLFNLSAGLYTVTVTNGNGCTSTASADLSIAGVPAVAVSSVTPASCGLSNGSVGISVSGVSGTMQYLWSNGATTQNLNNVPAGNYTVTVTNPVNGCGATTSALVGGPMVEPFMFLCQQQAPASMPGTADGVGVISLSGGTPGYTVTWSGGTITNPNAAVILMANLTAGSYPLTATDSGGCSAECMLVIQSASSSSCRASDSLSLRALFTATGGQGWINKTNWLVAGQPISTWHGITLNAQGCVTQIRLDNNNLSGVLPNLDMSQLQLLSLSGNKLEGTLPALNTPQLRRLNLRNNRLQNIAGLSHITTWNTVVAGTGYPDVLRLDGNIFTFEDLLPDLDLLEFWGDSARYAPQDSVFTDTLIVREIGASLSIDLGFDEQVPDNDYAWIKDGQPYQMLSSNKLIFNDLKEEDAGLYYASVTNHHLSQLTLYTRVIMLEVRPDAGGIFNGLTPDDPNGDNCCLVVDQLSEFPDAEMRIYNRWGELVFRQQPYDNRWRGTNMNFSDLPAGTYYYLLTPNREGYKPRRGFILLWR